jgi:hypothetical protein
MEHLRGHRLTNTESELLARQDLYAIDEDLLNEIAVSVPCDSCGKLVTITNKTSMIAARFGILHGFCSDCATKLMAEAVERDSILAP